MKLSKLHLPQFAWLARVPLIVLLMVPFLVQLSGAVGLIANLSYRSSQHSVNQLANQLMDQVAVRVKDRLDSYLQTPQSLIELNRTAVADGDLNLKDFEQLERFFYRRIHHFQALTTLSFGNTKGEVIGVGRDRPGLVVTPGSLTVWDNLGPKPLTRRFYKIDAQRRRLQQTHTDPNFDVRERAWYKAGVQANKQTWSPIFSIVGLPEAAVSAVTPVYQNGVLQGVFTSDLLLSDISLFLGALNFSSGGQAFIIERSGDLVATSTQEKVFTKDTGGQTFRRLNALDSQFESTRVTAQTMLKQVHNWNQIQSRQQFMFEVNHQPQFGYAIPYRDTYGLDWILITTIPESDFMTEINASNQRTLLLCGLTLLLAIGTGIALARWIANPIRRLQEAANAVAQGELDYSIKTGGVREVAQLSNAFQTMTQQLSQAARLQTNYEQELKQQVAEQTEALHQSEERFRLAVKHAPDVFVIYDSERRYLYVNERGLQRLELPLECIIGHRDEELFSSEITSQYLSILEETIATKALQTKECTIHLPGKSVFTFIVKYVPLLNEKNEIQQILGITFDISDRKHAENALQKSEARIRAILSAIPDTMLLMSKEGACLDSILANESKDSVPTNVNLVGKHTVEFLPPDLVNLRLRAIQQAISTGSPQVYEQQIEMPEKLQYEEIRVVPCSGDTALVVIRDISDRYEADRIKNEFISVVSHELRTPLTALRGSLGLLSSGFYDTKPEMAKSLLQVSLKSSDRLVRLVNDILDLERLESGKVELVKQACDVTHLMEQVIESVQVLAAQAGIYLSMVPLHVEVWVAPDAILQTLTNLLSNAIKFSPEGSTVWLRAEVSSQDSSKVLVTVQDQGRGIPADKLETIFDRFQQVNVSDSRQQGGTGLGLAICRSIVQQHGGRIWAESVLEQGSTFYFTLPRYQ